MWAQYVMLIGLVVASVQGREQCVCSRLHHPQKRFCNSQFAYKVEMLHAEDSHKPGDPGNSPELSHWKYTAEVQEVFKGGMYLSEASLAEIYTPGSASGLGFCGRMLLYDPDRRHNQHLITGTVEHNNGVEYLSITSCTWVTRWPDLTPEQKAGLRGEYQCVCNANSVSGQLLSSESPQYRFSMDRCLYNPVMATTLEVDDCESLYGYCNSECTWQSTHSYMMCFHRRREALMDVGQPAIASKQHCKVYAGRKRKMCILKFVKAQVRATRNHGPPPSAL